MKLLLLALFLSGCVDQSVRFADEPDAHFDHHKGEPANLWSFDGRKWIKTDRGSFVARSIWIDEVNLLARKEGYDIRGDEQYFRNYLQKGYTPRQAIWHWEHDPWPNNGGGP